MLAGFGPWTWLTLGAALLVIEVITPGTFVLWWLGISSPAEFDPDRFDLDEANSYLARISKVLIKA